MSSAPQSEIQESSREGERTTRMLLRLTVTQADVYRKREGSRILRRRTESTHGVVLHPCARTIPTY
jgi:citrate synthase